MSDFWQYGYWKENPRTGKKRFISLGYAKQRNDGGFFINADAHPPGDVELMIMPPRERNDSQQGYSNAGSAPQGGMDMDSDIPFGPAWQA
jgi:hypothetical protein